jgi:Ca2+-binding RTX toxin-like protein
MRKSARFLGAKLVSSVSVLFAVTLATMVLPDVGAEAAPLRCLGERATIVGTPRGEVIRGTAGRDVIVALGGADIIRGRGGNDVICAGRGADRILAGPSSSQPTASFEYEIVFGEGGNDELHGGAGFDVLVGGSGSDLLNGGTGSDIVVFDSAVVVDLGAGTATGEGSDTVQAVEHVQGSNLDDTLTGDEGANDFHGMGGDDAIDGGGGVDTVSYTFSGGPVSVDLTAGTATGQGSDTLASIENAIGSDYEDSIGGDSGSNVLVGLSGADVINGLDGDDFLYGVGGNDTLDGGNGTDELGGGRGTDTCINGETVSSCEA